jgi:DNA modification methylase
MIPRDQVIEGDCITLLAELPDASVTAMITDPPYPNGMNLFTEEIADGLAMLYLATKKVTGHIVFFWRASDVPRPPPGWYEIARHLWHKPDSNSRVPYEAIVVWSRERKNERCRFWSVPLLSLRSLGDWKPHPTQKPVQLLRYLVEAYTNEGDTVFDPFVGSGTTAIACQQLKRHFIAVERNPEYVAIARERLQRREQRAEERRQRTAETDQTGAGPEKMRRYPSESREEQQRLFSEPNDMQRPVPKMSKTPQPPATPPKSAKR